MRGRSDSRFSRQSRGISPPNLRLSVIIAFAIVALAGALFLAGFRHGPIKGNLAARGSEGVPVSAGASSNVPTVSSSFAAEESVQNLTAVPEPSTWISGIALALLVGARCFRARWRSYQRREAEKELRSFSSRFGERS